MRSIRRRRRRLNVGGVAVLSTPPALLRRADLDLQLLQRRVQLVALQLLPLRLKLGGLAVGPTLRLKAKLKSHFSHFSFFMVVNPDTPRVCPLEMVEGVD